MHMNLQQFQDPRAKVRNMCEALVEGVWKHKHTNMQPRDDGVWESLFQLSTNTQSSCPVRK